MDEQVAAPDQTHKPPKSPPMAFQMTSNDALAAPIHPSQSSQVAFHSPEYVFSPNTLQKLELETEDPIQQEMQAQIQKQAKALQLQHQAFMIERECWELERDRLYRRVASLESLLKTANGHSPAKSPVISPNNGIAFTPLQISRSSQASPVTHFSQHRSSTTSTSRLSSIAENDIPSGALAGRRRGSSITREAAPARIDLPPPPKIALLDGIAESQPSGVASVGTEIPGTPPVTRNTLSPPPAEYRQNAGHTPLRMPVRPILDPSPARSTFSESTDTPTKLNTERNLSIEVEEDDDQALKGPLHMPELPNTPGEGNFTMDMLTARLKVIEEHPDEHEPLALRARCNRRDSVPDTDRLNDEVSKEPTNSLAPIAEEKKAKENQVQEHKSEENKLDSTRTTSPPASISSQHVDDGEVDRGIRLRKKPSSNFGTPFGQLRSRDSSFKNF